MRQQVLFDEMRRIIDVNQNVKDPKQMASIIYFVLKQYPTIVATQRGYVKTLKLVKKLLSRIYGWRMTELHKLFCQLHKLTAYMKKST
jgi:hypothetical protein